MEMLETCGINARNGCDISLDFVDCAMIASSRALGSSTLLAIEQIMPNTWLLASVLPSSRSEIGTAAVIDLGGSAPRHAARERQHHVVQFAARRFRKGFGAA